MREEIYTFGNASVKIVEPNDNCEERQERQRKACERFFKAFEREKARKGIENDK